MSKIKKGEKSYKEWTSFWKLYQEAYKITGSQAQTKAAVIWNEIKNGDTNLNAEISKLNRVKIKRDSKTGLIWASFTKPSETASSSSSPHPSSSSSTSSPGSSTQVLSSKQFSSQVMVEPEGANDQSDGKSTISSPSGENTNEVIEVNEVDEANEEDDEKGNLTDVPDELKTPAQYKINNILEELRKKSLLMHQLKDNGMLSDVDRKQMYTIDKEIKEKEAKMHRLKLEAMRQKKRRETLKSRIATIAVDNPDLAPFNHDSPGRPRLETYHPDLLSVIEQIVSAGASSQERRRSEQLNSVKTLDELRELCRKRGYNFSRNAYYVRLLPRRSDSAEGKRHVKTVPVKLKRAQNNARKKHIDRNFAFATNEYVKEFCSIFGPKVVSFLAVDDKAKVPLGIAAATKQAPILMHLEYEVRLPDHTFRVGTAHKLIPSVTALCTILPNKFNEALTYSGPTYIAIRSMKHDKSNAFSHGRDLQEAFKLPEFQEYIMNDEMELKPTLFISTDGATDEGPRFPNTLAVAVQRFKENDLDVHILYTNAPGYSAYNRVERRMAPLSKELSGLVLPHDSCGTHLDESGRTIDTDLEKINFKRAGETLAEVWNNLEIDSHPVKAEFVEDEEITCSEVEEVWAAKHVRQSQYVLQIVKCHEQDCCSPWRSNWLNIVPTRFLPAPFPLQQTKRGVIVPEPKDHITLDDKKSPFASLTTRLAMSIYPKAAADFKEVPFDLFCPKVYLKIGDRLCPECCVYFPSKKAMKKHKKIHNLGGIHIPRPEAVYEKDTDDENVESNISNFSNQMPIIRDIFQFMKCPWDMNIEIDQK